MRMRGASLCSCLHVEASHILNPLSDEAQYIWVHSSGRWEVQDQVSEWQRVEGLRGV